jgi:hypothetical protein
MCGCIWTPPDCNGLVGSGPAITIADVYPASLSGPFFRRREPRWISARLICLRRAAGESRLESDLI